MSQINKKPGPVNANLSLALGAFILLSAILIVGLDRMARSGDALSDGDGVVAEAAPHPAVDPPGEVNARAPAPTPEVRTIVTAPPTTLIVQPAAVSQADCTDLNQIKCVYEMSPGSSRPLFLTQCVDSTCVDAQTRRLITVQQTEAPEAGDPEAARDAQITRDEPFICSASAAPAEARGANLAVATSRAIAECEAAQRLR